MCGICGIYNLNGEPVDSALLARMNNTMTHRGPDDEGYFLDGAVGLGHRRLSIIDLNTGHQPLFNEDGKIAVVFNGEIYNFQEIRTDLETRGHIFSTHTDTEVIVHSYEEWGTDCVDRFRGMFAFAVWDGRKRQLLLARDRLGIKPLYYFFDNKRLVFSSELKAIIENREVPHTLNMEALSDYLSLGYVPAPKTIFHGIKKLAPGHIFLLDRETAHEKKYWDIEFIPDSTITEDQWCDLILDTLDESIRLRRISDVPLGAFLSGGIDSSLVVAIMAKLSKSTVITNSVGFTLESYNELHHAKATSLLLKTDHHEYTVSPSAVEVVNQLSWHFDEPFADASAIPTYYVSQMTRENVKVALSGDGGDENFAGYRRYFFDSLENRIRDFLPDLLRTSLVGTMAKCYPKADWLPQVFRAKTLLTNISMDPVSAYFNSMSHFLSPMKRNLLSEDTKKALEGYDSSEVFRTYYNACSSQDPLSRTQYVDIKTYLADDILTKVDRASMAHSLEVRVPLLDHKFVELAARIPSNLKLNGRVSKYLLKKAGSRLLPQNILNRKKMGFSIPVGQWLKSDLKPMFEETVFNSASKRGLFNEQFVKQLWKKHCSGSGDFTQPLWTLFCFELWAKRFL